VARRRGVRVRLTDGMADLLNDPGVAGAVRKEAGKVLEAAKGIAPVASGAYRDSLRVYSFTSTLYRTPRTVYAVGSDAAHALAVEAKHGVLQRALDGAG
jgi:hypothetical protein